MDGMILGFAGGALVSVATLSGALLILLKENLKTDFLSSLRLDFLSGSVLLITGLSLMTPEAGQSFISLQMASFGLGILFLILSKKLLSNALDSIVVHNFKEQQSILFVTMSMLKSIPVGLAAGASLSMGHLGESNTLLAALSFLNVFEGIAIAVCFLSLGFESPMAIIATFICAIFTIAAGMVGGVLSLGSSSILSLIMLFSAGALMSGVCEVFFNFLKAEIKRSKVSTGSGFVSAFVVMLIFIVWKEML